MGRREKPADAILRGEWFGLSSTLDSESEKLLKEYEKAVANHRKVRRMWLVCAANCATVWAA